VNATPIQSPPASSSECCNADAASRRVPAELGLGPLPWLCGLWAAAACLLATGLPGAARFAAAALALQILARQCRTGRWVRRAGYLYLPRGPGDSWRFEAAAGLRGLRLAAVGRLPRAGWLLRLDGVPGGVWLWVADRRLDRSEARRLRAAITAGRT
jgi:hypothetical protein